ncbi:MAG: DUF3131 domain-containing protein [Deltaproteobacteria bacterium]|nr:DUF3131 domain-containing protein [Deltaproteobacteria bacterium]
MASIAFEKKGDPQTYSAWELAVHSFSEGGTDWAAEKQALQKQIAQSAAQLKATQSPDGNALLLKDDEVVLLELESELVLSQYNGPQPGFTSLPTTFAPTEEEDETSSHRYQDQSSDDSQNQADDSRQNDSSIPSELVESSSLTRSEPLMQPRPPRSSSDTSKENFALTLPGRGMLIPQEVASQSESRLAEPTPLAPDVTSEIEFPSGQAVVPLDAQAVQPPAQEGAGTSSPGSNDDKSSQGAPSSLPPFTGTDYTQSQDNPLDQAQHGFATALSTIQPKLGNIAWRYFAANRQTNTGMFNSVHIYPFTTMWDLGSSLAGLASAEQLGVITSDYFHQSVRLLLETLQLMPLYNQELPNREYTTQTAKMTDLKNRASTLGSGWSAIDLGRLLIWLKIIAHWYPEHAEQIQAFVARWQFARLAANREMNGTIRLDGAERLRQEGRLGYEQYAAMGFWLWGVELPNALDLKETRITEVLGFRLPYDIRDHAFLTSDPFFLAKLELGAISPEFDDLAQRLYLVQQKRWEQHNILTAVGEDAIDKQPWFVYNNVLFEGKPWHCVNNAGQPFPDYQNVSTKAALAWSALYPGSYAEALTRAVEGLVDERWGYYAGFYEKGGLNKSLNINTNAIVLETLLYLKRERQPFLVNTWRDAVKEKISESHSRSRETQERRARELVGDPAKEHFFLHHKPDE